MAPALPLLGPALDSSKTHCLLGSSQQSYRLRPAPYMPAPYSHVDSGLHLWLSARTCTLSTHTCTLQHPLALSRPSIAIRTTHLVERFLEKAHLHRQVILDSRRPSQGTMVMVEGTMITRLEHANPRPIMN